MIENTHDSGTTNGFDLALQGLQYLAGDVEQLNRFCSLTGVAPEDFRGLISETAFQAGILDFFLGHEPTLLAFAAHSGVDPAEVRKVRNKMMGPEGLTTQDGAEF